MDRVSLDRTGEHRMSRRRYKRYELDSHGLVYLYLFIMLSNAKAVQQANILATFVGARIRYESIELFYCLH